MPRPVASRQWRYFAYRNTNQVTELASKVGAITETPGWTLDSGILLACAISVLLPLQPIKRLNKRDFIGTLKQHAKGAEAGNVLTCLEEMLPDTSPDIVLTRLADTVPKPHAVPIALYAFLRCPESFSEAVMYAVSAGGETDKSGSMAGALAGAFLGEVLMPPVWRREVEGSQLMKRLAALDGK
jgi:ADP-ribosylglycohydrolase